jgi:hypothetical protein
VVFPEPEGAEMMNRMPLTQRPEAPP